MNFTRSTALTDPRNSLRRSRPSRSLVLCGVLLSLALGAVACGDDGGGGNNGGGGGGAGSSFGGSGNNGGSGFGGNDTGGAGKGGGNNGSSGNGASGSGSGNAGDDGGGTAGDDGGGGPMITFDDSLPAAGNPDGHCAIPSEAQAADSSHPDHVVGTGTKESCTGKAFVDAVALGGVITFDCGADPVTITLTETAKVFNDASDDIVIDGGGKVALSGGGNVRILYQNTCDEKQHFTTPHCDDQETPRLTVQNLTFLDGNAKNEDEGGGAIFASGGRLKIVNSRFFGNVCADVGPDIGGGAVRAFQQSMNQPLYVVNSTFGGSTELANVCSNGGGLSSIGVSYTVINSTFSYNEAIGNGANPAQPNTPGGGSGGAIYNDGGKFTLSLCGVNMNHNTANEGGGAIFYVSNDHTGTIEITDSTLTGNPSGKFETIPGIFLLAKDDKAIVTNSTIE